jgi:cell filamentation protein
MSTAQRAEEPLPAGRLTVTHYRAIHRHLFQDVYRWAGHFRTTRISKGGSMFCYPENIRPEMRRLFRWLNDQDLLRGREPAKFVADSAHFLAELNAVHAFRDGNGRAQLTMLALVSARAGHPLDFERLRDPRAFLKAMIASFRGDEGRLRLQLTRLLRTGTR